MSDESVHWRSTGKKNNTHFFCLHNSSSTDSLFYEIQYTTFDKLSEALLLLCFDTSCNSSLSRCFNLIGRAGLGWVDKRSQCFVRQHRLKVMCCHCWVFNWKHKSKIREGGGGISQGSQWADVSCFLRHNTSLQNRQSCDTCISQKLCTSHNMWHKAIIILYGA